MAPGHPWPSIDDLPDEVLLIVFRCLPAVDFVTKLPPVCGRWSAIVASDTKTLKRICVVHTNVGRNFDVKFAYVDGDEHGLFNRQPGLWLSLFLPHIPSSVPVPYTDVFYLSAQYSDVFRQVRTLVVGHNLLMYPIDGFTCTVGLTTVVFSGLVVRPRDQYTLMELGAVYPNVRNVMFINDCALLSGFELRFLHCGFGRLKRFRLDHHSVDVRLLEDMLTGHPELETLVLGYSGKVDDRWIEALIDKLGGRTIRHLSMHSPYFTDKCVQQFLATDRLVLNMPNVDVSRSIVSTPFSINFD